MMKGNITMKIISLLKRKPTQPTQPIKIVITVMNISIKLLFFSVGVPLAK